MNGKEKGLKGGNKQRGNNTSNCGSLYNITMNIGIICFIEFSIFLFSFDCLNPIQTNSNLCTNLILS